MHVPAHPVRFITAASLFDGHDAAINIMRRILQSQGVEVVHLGHNRSVDDIATAALQEDVQGVAVSSYQGGHVEYFEYLVDSLRERGRPDVKVFGGGGGVIVPEEIDRLHDYGVARIFTPEDGARMGLGAMVNTMVEACDVPLAAEPPASLEALYAGDQRTLARTITALEGGTLAAPLLDELRAAAARRSVPTLGITGTGGSGKSSLTDEIVRRFRLDQEDKLRIAVVAVDPTRRKAGGALLGDRIRMNSIDPDRVYFRSLATREATGEVPAVVADVITACKAAGFDLVIVETPGIGQGDAGIVPYVDVPIYVMTPEFGAASQLEKIEMLDHAEAVAVNKFDRRGGEDALRDVRRQLSRLRESWSEPPESLPVFGTIAARFNDDGVTALYQHLRDRLGFEAGVLPPVDTKVSTKARQIVPGNRTRYLGEIAEAVRRYHEQTDEQAAAARLAQHLRTAREHVTSAELDAAVAAAEGRLTEESRRLLAEWPQVAEEYRKAPPRESLSGSAIPRVAVPRIEDDGALLRWLRRENLPGRFPYTAGVFPLKREGEDPTRMFAGEGDPFRTNRRFHLLARDSEAARLSTAFDSVTLYGYDPDERPDIYGKVGNSGVSIATLDDMKALYDGFDLADPKTSVSMTINGPAPTILAMFLNTAMDQHPEDHEGVLRRVRGTVQADILKEDQGQNTCIFSTEFALGMMADIQEWFIEHGVRNFYSVSISGYHIAEAGANPITQLAFTLANGFTYVEAYLARGMKVDDFAPNFSFFFSNGMDPEYTVLGRVARRIWAVAMRERYGANERSQKLKYHVQTSGRSLHAQEMAFNDIRTTLQALIAIYDNCNSLHTNAYDEAVTTPTEESVRRALAVQLIINKEWGLAMNENPNQGSFVVDELTDLVEEAVLREFERLDERGGVLGAMETGYQRGRIQDESMLYEQRKHDGSLPIVGVNTFRNPRAEEQPPPTPPLARSTEDEKQSQLRRLREFQARHAAERPAMLARLREAALDGENVFAVLVDAVRCCSLGEITQTLFEVGGRYRRNV
ncbi:MAG TPA: fused isobutyryl-CoA mutase/GTPase IcmF [Acidimicrobiales bacterium]|nr:fused isobutyryl-CoA mutase/GTPase IcmF [Acidimicrobiales bacterium]